jgi:2,3-bisphosphoglycerate-independent phosphoglycerate mutase
MIWKNGIEKMKCVPPHDITGKKTAAHLPKGKGADVLLSLMERAREIMDASPVNKKRIAKGFNPANSIWLWGHGKKLSVPTYKKKYGIKGALISAVDLTKGLGICAGFDVINVKGATGYIDTNYIGKANAALRALNNCDFVYVHVEAPDEAGHQGSVKDKIMAIEDFDKKVVGTIIKGMKKFDDYRILLMPDHATPIRLMTHTSEPVPYVIYGTDRQAERPSVRPYNEYICRMKKVDSFEKGHKLMDYFLKR